MQEAHALLPSSHRSSSHRPSHPSSTSTVKWKKKSSGSPPSPRLVDDPKRRGVKMVVGSSGKPKESGPRKFPRSQSIKRALRWISTVIFARFPDGIEIQSYLDESGYLWISSNVDSVNDQIWKVVSTGSLRSTAKSISGLDVRQKRHWGHVYSKDIGMDSDMEAVLDAFENNRIRIPSYEFLAWKVFGDFSIGRPTGSGKPLKVHAERRIHYELQQKRQTLDETRLGGVKRPCAACALALKIQGSTRGFLFPDPGTLMSREGEFVASGTGVVPFYAQRGWRLKRHQKLLVVRNAKYWRIYKYKSYETKEVREYSGSLGGGLSHVTRSGKSTTTGYDTDSEEDEP